METETKYKFDYHPDKGLKESDQELIKKFFADFDFNRALKIADKLHTDKDFELYISTGKKFPIVEVLNLKDSSNSIAPRVSHKTGATQFPKTGVEIIKERNTFLYFLIWCHARHNEAHSEGQPIMSKYYVKFKGCPEPVSDYLALQVMEAHGKSLSKENIYDIAKIFRKASYFSSPMNQARIEALKEYVKKH